MKTIVVIDDEFSLAEVLSATLSDVGYRVYTAPNGRLGLDLMAEHQPHLVLLDYMMPLLDGPSVLKAMHADPKLAAVPVILMSSLPESRVRAKCSGYVAFLRKPFGIEALLSVVEKALVG